MRIDKYRLGGNKPLTNGDNNDIHDRKKFKTFIGSELDKRFIPMNDKSNDTNASFWAFVKTHDDVNEDAIRENAPSIKRELGEKDIRVAEEMERQYVAE